MTPKLFQKYVEAYNKRLEDTMLMTDLTNHQLGLYIRQAIADVLSDKQPKYPDTPVLVDNYDAYKQQQQNPVRWFSKEETEAWLEQRRKERENSDVQDSKHQGNG